MLKRVAGIGLVALVLAGCGGAPTAPKAQRLPVAPQAAGYAPMPGGAPMGMNPGLQAGAQAGAQEGAQLLASARQALAQARGFQATVRSVGEGEYEGGKRVARRKVVSSFKVLWVKPRMIRAEVLETTNKLAEGAALVTTDGESLRVRAKGVLGLFPLSLQPDNAMLRNLRNHTYPEQDPANQFKRLTAEGAVWTVVGQTMGPSGPMKLVQIDQVRRLDGEIDREILTLDPTTVRLGAIAMFSRGKVVLEHTFTQFAWNPRVAPDAFQL